MGTNDAIKYIVLQRGCKKENDNLTRCCNNFHKCSNEKKQLDACFENMVKTLLKKGPKCSKQLDVYADCIKDHPNGLQFCVNEKTKFENECSLSKR